MASSNAAAHRLALVCLGLAAVIGFAALIGQWARPSGAHDDLVGRLVLLVTVLYAGALYASSRFQILPPEVLAGGGIGFEVLAVFSTALAETAQPATAALGISAGALVIGGTGAALPHRAPLVLAAGCAAAIAGIAAYGVNAARLHFAFDPVYAAVSSVPNLAVAMLTYVLARSTRPERRVDSSHEIGSYELVELIGEGGMGEVWRARHHMLARPAAVKIIRAGVTGVVNTARFRREANVIASLQSPHTVYLYDFGTTSDGRLYYVMELLEGISLQALVTKYGPQPPRRVVAILRQICLSLEEAHQRAFVHRDLKPSNVMLCTVAGRHDFAKVLDFGLARPVAVDPSSNLTVEGVVVGTPEYMAPEVAMTSRNIDGRADIYAVGCIAYVLLTGTLVFDDENPLKLALRHVRDTPAPPSTRTDRAIPGALDAIVMTCLKKHPPARPSARELEQMLASVDAGSWTEDDAAEWWAQHGPSPAPASPVAQPQNA